jgi:hypothetical protein
MGGSLREEVEERMRECLGVYVVENMSKSCPTRQLKSGPEVSIE